MFTLAVVLVVFTSSITANHNVYAEPVVLRMWLPNAPPEQEISRIFTRDVEKLGIKVELISANYDDWTANIINSENPYQLVMATWGSSPDRMDPDFFLSEMFHSGRATKGGRNYGYYINKDVDNLLDAQRKEMNRQKRQQAVRRVQEVIAKDNAFYNIYHKEYFQAYNSDRIEGAIAVVGSGVGFPYIPLTYLNARPKTTKREITAVCIHDIFSLNPFYVPEVENEWWLRLIYDPLVRLDKDLNIVPWAAKSWKIVDNTTVDVTLRDGMKFHDGRPVTVDDLKFTVDYIKEWKFPALSRVWKNVDNVRVVDRQTVRFKLVEPYAPLVRQCPFVPVHRPEACLGEDSADWRREESSGLY